MNLHREILAKILRNFFYTFLDFPSHQANFNEILSIKEMSKSLKISPENNPCCSGKMLRHRQVTCKSTDDTPTLMRSKGRPKDP